MGLGWHPIYDGKFKKLPKHQPAKLPMWTVGKLGRKIRTPSPGPFLALWNKVPPIWTEKTIIWLVVLTILKNMSSSVGIIVPNIWEVMKFHGSSHHQPVMFPLGLPFGWCLESGIPANPKPYHPDIRKLHDFTRKKKHHSLGEGWKEMTQILDSVSLPGSLPHCFWSTNLQWRRCGNCSLAAVNPWLTSSDTSILAWSCQDLWNNPFFWVESQLCVVIYHLSSFELL